MTPNGPGEPVLLGIRRVLGDQSLRRLRDPRFANQCLDTFGRYAREVNLQADEAGPGILATHGCRVPGIGGGRVGGCLGDVEHSGGLVAANSQERPATHLPYGHLENMMLLLGDLRQRPSPTGGSSYWSHPGTESLCH